MIVTRFEFSRDDSCHKLGLRHPVYAVLEKLRQLGPGEGVEVVTDDFDWALTIETVARGAAYEVAREDASGRARIVIYRRVAT
ncbi:hypothetical protein [Pyrobaculum ferrireducens]|uniref:Uncharacterized protein n=1 Tax=Pyrobaculum ferrireducens TaxID=1104324 RepID=G7VHW2_9CREN|nr:hypothetical protein [Pyrobaculum ferrireducens]AET33322.1 hypothetical protein P186_1920 [Pyrobaculum ferrireducens]